MIRTRSLRRAVLTARMGSDDDDDDGMQAVCLRDLERYRRCRATKSAYS
jgi:hypothetical protein